MQGLNTLAWSALNSEAQNLRTVVEMPQDAVDLGSRCSVRSTHVTDLGSRRGLGHRPCLGEPGCLPVPDYGQSHGVLAYPVYTTLIRDQAAAAALGLELVGGWNTSNTPCRATRWRSRAVDS